MFTYRKAKLGLGSKCEVILRSLPEWFGREDALEEYVDDISRLPTYSAWKDDELVGFITINQHFPYAAEMHVLGVHRNYHSMGIGSELFRIVHSDLAKNNVKFVQVKTLSPKTGNAHYKRTLSFYKKHGYVEMEEFPLLWGEGSPCLQLVKNIS